ncbi:response regulator transcription factor [Brevundimonas sp. NPDC092305]|uniref:response regulator transcription factor n=1 Tax=Brevundimonas sp. NPDC092305 TaxID=3363957 RepID=UPI00382717DE
MRWVVLIVDDHPLVAQALELAVRAAYPHLDVARAASATEAEDHARVGAGRIRLVLLDLILPDAKGFDALLRLQQRLPDCPICIISGRTDPHSVAMARSLGAAGFLGKNEPVEKLVNSVGDMLRGERPFSDAREEVGADQRAVSRRLQSLSAAQLRVLAGLAEGKLNKQIAHDLGVTEGTVKQHLNAIFRKLDVRNRSQAILAAGPYLDEIKRPDRSRQAS